MTTNQTIDGVPRDLLQKIADGGYCHQGLMDRIRALLDAPIYPNRLCHIDYKAHPYICGCLKGDEESQRRYDEHQARAAQDQGEPVAVVLPERKTITPGLLSESNTHNQGWNACLDEFTRLNNG